MAFELELVSPIEIAKDAALAVQEYTLLSAQSLANFFAAPCTWATCCTRRT